MSILIDPNYKYYNLALRDLVLQVQWYTPIKSLLDCAKKKRRASTQEEETKRIADPSDLVATIGV
ncbi:hypothetical protein CC2G_003346 [Coprinopsis cinerea AmutBmut pab1-1]|nr:hypothetical protein CC2G_003346 [Coprinopsis cinerea AmutBmut pab1-1]